VAPSASAVTFESTVIDAGRRVQSVTLFNATQNTIGVSSASLDPLGPFSIESDECAGTRIIALGSCSIEVQFAPTDVGLAAAVATFRIDDGSVITASITGEGVPEPTLDLVPAVAGTGQTVTVFGAGFPPGSVIEMMQPGVEAAQSVAIDPDGTFAHVVVILPNTPTGPATLEATGQADAFADVTVELLVSSRGSTSDGAALRSSVANPTRR